MAQQRHHALLEQRLAGALAQPGFGAWLQLCLVVQAEGVGGQVVHVLHLARCKVPTAFGECLAEQQGHGQRARPL